MRQDHRFHNYLLGVGGNVRDVRFSYLYCLFGHSVCVHCRDLRNFYLFVRSLVRLS